ncbi:hypothetical protein [Qipengyuania qiaonensis]|uniref:Lipoprotein n=1 Tax=Qipengyuania qiaonensis TaxID=2867240 RepID=A0ABS7J5D0_9SPHN|nr:hypothetical protein [Qipengyuania qiaonensis]MBX7482496.1 hypothetical protein [Qipengyuania qiaonensis]
MTRGPRKHLATIPAAVLAIGACSGDTPDSRNIDAPQRIDPPDSYDIDSATGETRARHTDGDGTTTIMRSGAKVPVRLPAGFALYPDVKVTDNTWVEQSDGLLVLLDFESDASVEDLVAYYREQADTAGIEVATSLQTGPMTMIGGENGDGTSFSLTATRGGELTKAQLSISHGLE